jgi:DDE domain
MRTRRPPRGGAAGRTRRGGRPRHHLPVGAAVHAAAGRGCPALPPRLSVIAGRSTRPMGRSPAAGATSTERSTSSARSWTCSSPDAETPTPPAGSWSGHRHDQGHRRRGHHRSGAGLPAVLKALLPAAWHRTDRYANNRVEADHGRPKARLRPMRGLKQEHSVRVVIAGHAFIQNLRRGHYGAGR